MLKIGQRKTKPHTFCDGGSQVLLKPDSKKE